MAATRGTTQLKQAGIEHRVFEYQYARGGSVAGHAAQQVGIEPERVFKSLVARLGDELVFALLPATAELSPKKLAAAAGAKSAEMADPRDAERATGYQVGGISPLGSKRQLRVFVDASAKEHEWICLNAGRRGALVEVATGDLVTVTKAVLTDLSA